MTSYCLANFWHFVLCFAFHGLCVSKFSNTAQVFVELEHLARKCLAMGATPSYLTWSNDRWSWLSCHYYHIMVIISWLSYHDYHGCHTILLDMVQRQVGDDHDYHYQYHHVSNFRINGKVESKLLMYIVYQGPAPPNIIINNNSRACISQYDNQQKLKGRHVPIW